jgi:hypothetical protein
VLLADIVEDGAEEERTADPAEESGTLFRRGLSIEERFRVEEAAEAERVRTSVLGARKQNRKQQ